MAPKQIIYCVLFYDAVTVSDCIASLLPRLMGNELLGD
jgi:hypothetical protein